MPNSITNILDNTKLYIENGDYMLLKAGSTLNLGNNVELILNGFMANLTTESGVTINCGTNSSIKVLNDSWIHLNGVTLNCSSQWNGIYFENARASTIENCNIYNAMTPIKIITTYPYTNANQFQYISTNNFYTIQNTDCGIYMENVHSISIYNNKFYLSSDINSQTIGVRIHSSNNFSSTNYSLSIVNNEFYNGAVSLALTNYASDYKPYYIDNNTFSGNNVARNIYSRLIYGDIKNNHFNNNSSNNSNTIQFFQSNPNLFNNTILSSSACIDNISSSIHLAPLETDDNKLIWTSGRNHLESNNYDNIIFTNGYAYLKNGENIFLKNSSNCFHLFGSVNLMEDPYYVLNNCFNNSNQPTASIWNISNYQPITPIWQGSTLQCNPSNTVTDYIITDKGFGIIDTIYISPNNYGIQLQPDENIYSQALSYSLNNDYYNAVNTYKTLISNYKQSNYSITSLYEIYSCYEKLDTSGLQNIRNILFGDLLNFLENKIESGLYSDDFIDVAFNITLMCSSKMADYVDAAKGYEFIALFNPDYEIRLMASWDYDVIEALLGNGGSISEKEKKMSDEDFIIEKELKFLKLTKNDPILKKVKEVYETKKENKKAIESQEISKDANKSNNNIQNKRNYEKKIESNVTYNLRNSKFLKREEKEKKQLQDILLLVKGNSPNKENNTNIIPDKYELSQNYPNPFNPMTNIKYQIPKNCFVSIKIYDITGREIAKLVNDYKQAGYYTVTFNGSNFASGVYFYRIQSGDFVQVKKMVLIK
jgi:hypothetical protein